MRLLTKLSLLFVITILACSCFTGKHINESYTTVVPLYDTVHMRDGSVIYGLPRTVFTVLVNTERIIEKPGPYGRYSGNLIGLDDVITEKKESWLITGIIIRTHEELDPSELYIINTNTVFNSNVLALKKEGLILDINPAMYDDIGNQITTRNKSIIDQFASYDYGSDEYFQLHRDTAYKRVKIDSAFIRVPYIVENNRRLTIEQLAVRAARKLMEIREGKHLILTGEANVFPQSDAAINELNRMEKELTELFTGKTIRETKQFIYHIIPSRDMVGKPVVLLNFSEDEGPLDSSSDIGVPVIVEFLPEQKTKDISVINKEKTGLSISKYDKLFYRVPDVVNVKIKEGEELIFNSRRLIYQMGEIVELPSNYIIGK